MWKPVILVYLSVFLESRLLLEMFIQDSIGVRTGCAGSALCAFVQPNV